MTRYGWLWLLVPPTLFMLLALAGCAGGPPPAASAIPYSPTLLTQNRKDVADQWAADVARLQLVAPYLNAICAADGPWAKARDAWIEQQKNLWRDVLWHFEPIPNAPAGGGMGGDIGAMIGSVLGGLVKGGLLGVAPPRTALPPGLPPC